MPLAIRPKPIDIDLNSLTIFSSAVTKYSRTYAYPSYLKALLNCHRKHSFTILPSKTNELSAYIELLYCFPLTTSQVQGIENSIKNRITKLLTRSSVYFHFDKTRFPAQSIKMQIYLAKNKKTYQKNYNPNNKAWGGHSYGFCENWTGVICVYQVNGLGINAIDHESAHVVSYALVGFDGIQIMQKIKAFIEGIAEKLAHTKNCRHFKKIVADLKGNYPKLKSICKLGYGDSTLYTYGWLMVAFLLCDPSKAFHILEAFREGIEQKVMQLLDTLAAQEQKLFEGFLKQSLIQKTTACLVDTKDPIPFNKENAKKLSDLHTNAAKKESSAKNKEMIPYNKMLRFFAGGTVEYSQQGQSGNKSHSKKI